MFFDCKVSTRQHFEPRLFWKNAKKLRICALFIFSDGGYGDILNVLERLESETKNDKESEDNDSGRPQSEQNGSLSDFSSPKRASSTGPTGAFSNKASKSTSKLRSSQTMAVQKGSKVK